MPKFLRKSTVTNDLRAITTRLGAGTAANQRFTQGDLKKFVKVTGESRYDLAAVGDPIEGVAIALEAATQDGYSIGSVVQGGTLDVQFDGSQAAGTGAIAIGDFVVVGAVDALQTPLSTKFPKVRKATVQLGAVPGDLTAAAAQIKASLFAWRVVSLGDVGSGAVGTVGLIERVVTNG